MSKRGRMSFTESQVSSLSLRRWRVTLSLLESETGFHRNPVYGCAKTRYLWYVHPFGLGTYFTRYRSSYHTRFPRTCRNLYQPKPGWHPYNHRHGRIISFGLDKLLYIVGGRRLTMRLQRSQPISQIFRLLRCRFFLSSPSLRVRLRAHLDCNIHSLMCASGVNM